MAVQAAVLDGLRTGWAGRSGGRVVGALALAGVCCASSCASAHRFLGYRPSGASAGVTSAHDSEADSPDAAVARTQEKDQRARADLAAPESDSADPFLDADRSPIQLASAEVAAPTSEAPPATVGSPWAPELTAAPAALPTPRLNDAAIAAAVCHPPIARTPLPSTICPQEDCPGECPAGECPACPGSSTAVRSGPRPFPQEDGSDEYVCDGGDADASVHFAPDGLAGVEAEDTVGEYVDDEGRRHIQPSSRVCVYAPRFGVARSVEAPLASQDVDKAAGAQDGVQLAGYSHRMGLREAVDRDAPQKLQTRTRSNGLVHQQSEWALAREQAAAESTKLVNAFEDLAFVQQGAYQSSEAGLLYKAALAASEWLTEQTPVVVAENLAGQEVAAAFNVAEYIGAEDMRTPGELRIVKLADRPTARLGERVQFTLRFDNLGDRELRRLRIVDHLSPRLRLVEETVACDLAGELEITEGEDGGEVLTFSLETPLQGGTGGAITFECVVR